MTGSRPLVSISCITYNHEDYIETAIKGFLAQEANFKFEVLIHDDASTDGTSEIINRYAKLYPDIIKPYIQKVNQYSLGVRAMSLRFNFPRAKGKYIALCEGDDYWTDPHKLQRQVDFLENNSDYSLCFHPVKVVYPGGEKPDAIYPDPAQGNNFDLRHLIGTNFIQTNSVLYRKQQYENVNLEVMPGDWYLHLYHAQYGKIGFIDEAMSVYRRHTGGVWWNSTKEGGSDAIWKQYGVAHVALYLEMLKMFGKSPDYREAATRHVEVSLREFIRIDRESNTHLFDECIRHFAGGDNEIASIIADLISKQEEYAARTMSDLESTQKLLDKSEKELIDIKSSKVYRYAQKAARLKSKLIK